jgi:hypothetical protein
MQTGVVSQTNGDGGAVLVNGAGVGSTGVGLEGTGFAAVGAGVP